MSTQAAGPVVILHIPPTRSGPTFSTSIAIPVVHTTVLATPWTSRAKTCRCRLYRWVRGAVHSRIVAPSRMRRPTRNGRRREVLRSVYMPHGTMRRHQMNRSLDDIYQCAHPKKRSIQSQTSPAISLSRTGSCPRGPGLVMRMGGWGRSRRTRTDRCRRRRR